MSRISRAQRIIVILLTFSGVLAFTYVSVSIGLAMILAYQPQGNTSKQSYRLPVELGPSAAVKNATTRLTYSAFIT
jgi:hypothetical protein